MVTTGSPAHPNSCPWPHMDVALGQPPDLSLSPTLPHTGTGCSSFQHLPPSYPFSPWMIYERCCSCPRLQLPYPSPAPAALPLLQASTTTLGKKFNVPAGTRGQHRASWDPVPFSCASPTCQTSAVLCPLPGAPSCPPRDTSLGASLGSVGTPMLHQHLLFQKQLQPLYL